MGRSRRGPSARPRASARRTPGRPSRSPEKRKTGALAAILVFAVLAGVALYLARERRIAGGWGFALDDSWIHAQIARNLAGGRGMSFNAGEHAAGSTAPLYTLLLAFLYPLTGEFVWTAKVLGVLCQCGSALLVFFAVLRLDPGKLARAFFAGAVVAISPALLWASLSGMEIPLYLLLVCAGIYCYAAGKPLAATLLWALGVWVRPDGLFLLALSFILMRKDFPRRALGALAIVLAFLAFNHAIGGTLLPQTVGAKTRFGFDPIGRSWSLLREWGALWGIPYRSYDQLEHPVILFAGIAAGAVALSRRHPLFALYCIGLPLALSLFRDHSGSAKRYILYVVPFGAILAAYGFDLLSRKFLRRRAAVGLVATAALALAWQGAYAARRATVYAWNVQNINHMQRYMGRLAREASHPGDRIATNDIGAIGFFSERPIVDLMGLVTPREPLPQALSRYQPKLLIIFVDWFRDYAEYDPAHDTFYFYDSDSTHRYAVIAGVELSHDTISGKDQMIMFQRYPRGAPPPERRLLRRF